MLANLFLRKGKAKNINNLGSKTILSVPNVRNKMHPTEKPVELMQILIENSSNENFDIINKFIDICKIYENIIITYYRYKNKESQHSAKVRLDEFKEDNNINITNPTLLPRKVDIQDPPVKENVSKETLQNSITDVERDIQKENNVSTFKRTNTTDSEAQSKRIN